MESYDDIEIVQQPSNFKRILYKHQLAAVYKLEKLELQGKEANSDSFDETPIVSKEQDDFDWSSYVVQESHSAAKVS